MHSRKICISLYRSSCLEVFCKKCAPKVSQNSQKNTCAGVSSLKKGVQRGCFPVSFAKFLRTSFSQNTSDGCFCNSTFLIMKSCSKSTAEKQGKICWLVARWSGGGFQQKEWFRVVSGWFPMVSVGCGWYRMVSGGLLF